MDIDPNTRPDIPGATWIALSKGLWALVDDWLDPPKFYTKTDKKRSTYYGKRNVDIGDRKYIYFFLHHWVWRQYNSPLPKAIDHINGHGWDNRGCNLRAATGSQNQGNRRFSKNNTSGFRGIHWHKRDKVWVAAIGGRWVASGKDIIKVAKAWDRAAIKYFGQFVKYKLNFPNENTENF